MTGPLPVLFGAAVNAPHVPIAGFQCHVIQNRSKYKSKPCNSLSQESGTRKKVNIQRPSPRFGLEKAYPNIKAKNPFEAKIYMNISFQLL